MLRPRAMSTSLHAVMHEDQASQAGDQQAYSMAEAVARRSYGKLVAFLAARTCDVTEAEDALSEAFTTALAHWPLHGCPENPEAWLLTAARRKIIDAARRRATGEAAAGQVQILAEGVDDLMADAEIPDRRLALMFACAHPAIEASIRAPLIMQVLLGLDAKLIAAAFLMAPGTMGKRLVRAKHKIRQAGIPLRIPEHAQLPARLDSVLEALYAAFAEGWNDPGGIDIVRRDLTEEALFLAGLVAELLPEEPEALGLFACMLYAEARRSARRNADGEYIPFAEQNPALWNWPQIYQAETLIRRASLLGSIGRYQLEAALQSAHVYRHYTGQANWAAIVQLYDALLAITGSPVIGVNRALAIAELQGVSSGITALQALADDARLAAYQPYWAARAELMAKAGIYAAARQAYQIAISLERDPAIRRFLQRRQLDLPAIA